MSKKKRKRLTQTQIKEMVEGKKKDRRQGRSRERSRDKRGT